MMTTQLFTGLELIVVICGFCAVFCPLFCWTIAGE
jgi:hypothetical protein